MNSKGKTKSKIKNKFKKVAFKIIQPFLPFIIIIVGLFFAVCTIVDAIFIQEVQSDSSSMPQAQQELRAKCIKKAETLNTCNNFIGTEKTNYLLDIDSRETDKEVQWSHLYALMAFHNMTNGIEINENLLNQVSENFESNFIYEKMTIKIETTTKDESGNENTSTKEESAYILIESNTIIRTL